MLGEKGKALLIGPSSLTGQWATEVDKFFGQRRLPYTLAEKGRHGRKPIHAVQDFKQSRARLLIISYDLAGQSLIRAILPMRHSASFPYT